MKKKLAALAVTGASLGLFAVGSPSAGAAHCVEGDSPGYSYYGADHVQESDHNEGMNEAHTPGASSCMELTGNPSGRAPGQNR